MSLIPGIAGQKTELFDGAKIDIISEYTVGNGVQIQGRTNGVAIATGYVGEVIASTLVTSTAARSGTNIASTLLRSLTLTKGTYYITMYANVNSTVTGALGRYRVYSGIVTGAGTTYGGANDLWITTSGVVGNNAANAIVTVTTDGTFGLYVDTISGSLTTDASYTMVSQLTALRVA